MTEPKRFIIFVPSDGSAYERMDHPEGDWIYDPDHKIDLRNITSKYSGRDEAWFCSTCKNDENHGEFCESCGEPRR